jgi:outer membrane protein assembly factor BamB
LCRHARVRGWNSVFNDSDNRHTLVNDENGEILWSLDNPSHECNGSGVIEQNGILYIPYTDGYLAAVDVKSGERHQNKHGWQRPHQALNYQTPFQVYRNGLEKAAS